MWLQDFRTGYYTLASPKALFSVQVVGAFLGVLFAPAVFAFYNHAFKIGVDYLYSAPYAGIYRGMGIVAANGVSTLPRHCLLIACLMALGAVCMNLIRVRLPLSLRVRQSPNTHAWPRSILVDCVHVCACSQSLRRVKPLCSDAWFDAQDFLLPQRYKKFMPIPSAISIPFYIGAPIAIDFCLGGAVIFLWRLIRPETAAKYGIVTGAGLMVGDGIWQLPFGILGIAKVNQV